MMTNIVWGPENFSAQSGAYALLLNLATPRTLPIPRRRPAEIPRGLLVYAGNAGGAGGIRSRVARHFRRRKPLHWHIDWLTADGDIVAAAAFSTLKECQIIARVRHLAACDIPARGFGSSDCRTCPSHLLHLEAGIDVRDLLDALAPDAIWLAPLDGPEANG